MKLMKNKTLKMPALNKISLGNSSKALMTSMLAVFVLSSCSSHNVLFPNRVHEFELAFSSAQSNNDEKVNSWAYGYDVPLCRLNTHIEMTKAFTETALQNNPNIADLPQELRNKPFVTLQLQDKNKQRSVTVALSYQAESSEVWLQASLDNGNNEYLARTRLAEEVEIELQSRPQGDYVLSFYTPARPFADSDSADYSATFASNIREHAMKMQSVGMNHVQQAGGSKQSKKSSTLGEPQRFDFYPDFEVQHISVQSFAADTKLTPMVVETGCSTTTYMYKLPNGVV